MKNLECNTSNCEYNIRSRCNAGIININQKGVCTTHMKREGGVLAQSFADVEAGEDFGTLKDVNTRISCDSTHCKYNKNHNCNAKGIILDDGFLRTKCHTKDTK